MSTTPSNPAFSPELTDADVEKYIRQIAAEEAAKKGEPNTPGTLPATPITPEPLRLNIAGKEYAFKDAQEASAVLSGVVTSQAAPPPQPVGRQVTSDADTNTWTADDQKKYVDLLVVNPLHAQEYLDEKRFGVKDPTAFMRNQMQAIQQLTQTHTIDHFVSTHKDYHVCPENAQAMEGVMKEYGYPVSPAGLEAAYAIAKNRGKLKSSEQTSNPAQPEAYNPYLAAPPVASRGSQGDPSPDWMDQAWDMPIDKLEGVLNRFGGQQ